MTNRKTHGNTAISFNHSPSFSCENPIEFGLSDRKRLQLEPIAFCFFFVHNVSVFQCLLLFKITWYSKAFSHQYILSIEIWIIPFTFKAVKVLRHLGRSKLQIIKITALMWSVWFCEPVLHAFLVLGKFIYIGDCYRWFLCIKNKIRYCWQRKNSKAIIFGPLVIHLEEHLWLRHNKVWDYILIQRFGRFVPWIQKGWRIEFCLEHQPSWLRLSRSVRCQAEVLSALVADQAGAQSPNLISVTYFLVPHTSDSDLAAIAFSNHENVLFFPQSINKLW